MHWFSWRRTAPPSITNAHHGRPVFFNLQTNLGQRDRQTDFGREVQHLFQYRAGLTFEDQLHQQAIGHFLSV